MALMVNALFFSRIIIALPNNFGTDLLKWLLTISRPAAMTSTTSNGEAPEPAPS